MRKHFILLKVLVKKQVNKQTINQEEKRTKTALKKSPNVFLKI